MKRLVWFGAIQETAALRAEDGHFPMVQHVKQNGTDTANPAIVLMANV